MTKTRSWQLALSFRNKGYKTMMVRIKKYRRSKKQSLTVLVVISLVLSATLIYISFIIRIFQTTINNKEDIIRNENNNNHHYHHDVEYSTPAILRPSSSSSSSTQLRVAVIVAGTLQRFMFNSTLEHLIQPMVLPPQQQQPQQIVVDYYASLTTAKAKAYRSGSGYTDHVQSDITLPRIRSNSGNDDDDDNHDGDDNNIIETYMRKQLESLGASIGAIHIQERIDIDAEPLLQARRKKAKRNYPKEDPDTRFPILDIRSTEIVFRTANANRNLLRMHLAIQQLWTSALEREVQQGKPYDYVMFLRDDALWLDDFSLADMVEEEGDVYIPSCDARNPPMDPHEMNDHILISKRRVADLFGNYYSTLLQHKKADDDIVQQCMHTLSPHLTKGNKRGCNSEMLLKYICDLEGLHVTKVSQSQIPFQRSVNVKLPDGSNQQCFHKFCQSKSMPLQLHQDIQKCKDIDWNTIFPPPPSSEK